METVFTFLLPNDKVKYLKREFNDNEIKILSESNEHSEIEIKLNQNGVTLIKLFFAGVNAGLNMSREFFK